MGLCGACKGRLVIWDAGGAVGGRAGVLWSFRVRQGRLIPGGNCEVPLAELGCESAPGTGMGATGEDLGPPGG